MLKSIKLYQENVSQQLQSSVTPVKESYSNRIQGLCHHEQQILNMIYDENIEELNILKIQRQNLNFLEEFLLLPIDQKISPLVLACYKGNFEIVKLLLQNEDIDPNLGTIEHEYTPLMVTCMSGQYEIASMLINQGADVNQQNDQGQTPLLFCFSRLEENTNHFENKRICMKMASLLFENGADIDKIVNFKKQYSILMIFCSVKYPLSKRELDVNIVMIKFLLEHGANRYLKNVKGKDCFLLAQKHQQSDKIIHLLKNTKQIYFQDVNQGDLKESSRIKLKKCQIDKEGKSNQCCTVFSWFTNIFE